MSFTQCVTRGVSQFAVEGSTSMFGFFPRSPRIKISRPLLIGLCLVLLLFIVILLQGDKRYPVLWAGFYGVRLRSGHIGGVKTWELYSKDGTAIPLPECCLFHKQIVYWSPADKCLCVVSLKEKPRWIELGNQVPERWIVKYLSASRGGVLVNVVPRSYGSPGALVIKVDLESGSIKLIPGAKEAKSSEDSVLLALLNDDSSLEIRGENSRWRVPWKG